MSSDNTVKNDDERFLKPSADRAESVRLIVKATHQPPIDTPASIEWKTIRVVSPELRRLLETHSERGSLTTYEVIGAEVMHE